ncbi:PPE domain-containing protein, partial [Mycobacterium tuberculosis]
RQLADSVRTTAESLNTTLDELHENWKGSSSEWMADAALRYL